MITKSTSSSKSDKEQQLNFFSSRKKLKVKSENGKYRSATSDEILKAARLIINQRYCQGKTLLSTDESIDFLKLKLGYLDYEQFSILWLDNKNRVIVFEELFRGSIDGCNVYPREIVKSALAYKATACILAHNHPSGSNTPSQSDKDITKQIKEALLLIDVKVLDHIIVAENCFSFVKNDLL